MEKRTKRNSKIYKKIDAQIKAKELENSKIEKLDNDLTLSINYKGKNKDNSKLVLALSMIIVLLIILFITVVMYYEQK